MQKKIIRAGNAILGNSPFRLESNIDLLIEDNLIKGIFPANTYPIDDETKLINYDNYLVSPGFIQTHIHLCQTLFRGLADDLELLDWLLKVIFPLEASHNKDSIFYSAQLGLSELIRSGTTTIMDMGTINHEEILIDRISKSGLRAFVGKAMMDSNPIFPPLSESTGDSIKSSCELAKYVRENYSGKLNYAFTPRFILSCTDELLIEAFKLANEFPDTLFHTHASENKKEIQQVFTRCKMRNLEYFEQIGILNERTCLAHCIWLNSKEIDLLNDYKCKVLHCPSSNLKLGSGIARIPFLLQKGINVSLGADGAPCNNNLSILTEMRLASLIQKPESPLLMSAIKTFEIATMGGAITLGKEKEIGSIEVGKKADLVFWDLDRSWNPLVQNTLGSVLAAIVYSSREENIKSVMIDGEFVMNAGNLLTINEEEAIMKGKEELNKLLSTAQFVA